MLAPPPESNAGIRASGLLDHIQRPAKVHSDGAQSWPAQLRGRSLRGDAVSHKNHEYARPLQPHERVRGLPTAAGTQMVDRSWRTLCNHFLPVSLHAKARKEDKTSYTNDDLFLYAWAFAGRLNLPDDQRNANLWTFFGSVCSASPSVPPE